MREALTEAEIHRLGVHIIREELQQEGWIILELNVNPKVNPQIIARRNGTLGHVLVRTAKHPKRGAVENDDVARSCMEHASRHNARCFFAGLRDRPGSTTRGPWGFPSRAKGSSSPFRAWRS
ncbi:MAG: hypothetical protein MUF17_10765 [Syntrophales bacterium]|nr:hypothetical protein [Syntrophales bacterium]